MTKNHTAADKYLQRAESIVDKAITYKGEVASLQTRNDGNIKSFEDTVSPVVYAEYFHTALAEVDAGNWATAYETARNTTIGRTAMTLRNQAQA